MGRRRKLGKVLLYHIRLKISNKNANAQLQQSYENPIRVLLASEGCHTTVFSCLVR